MLISPFHIRPGVTSLADKFTYRKIIQQGIIYLNCPRRFFFQFRTGERILRKRPRKSDALLPIRQFYRSHVIQDLFLRNGRIRRGNKLTSYAFNNRPWVSSMEIAARSPVRRCRGGWGRVFSVEIRFVTAQTRRINENSAPTSRFLALQFHPEFPRGRINRLTRDINFFFVFVTILTRLFWIKFEKKIIKHHLNDRI